MESRSVIGSILSSANSTEILFFIHDNPYCKKSDIYTSVTRNAHTPEKIERLVSLGLIDVDMPGRSKTSFLTLTERGNRVVELLMEAERVITGDQSVMDEDD